MTATVMDGKATLAEILEDLRTGQKLAAAGVTPGAGHRAGRRRPGPHAYVGGKHRDCAEVGIASIRRELPADATQAEVEEASPSSTRIRPAPATSSNCRCRDGSTPSAVLERIDPDKDADGLHPVNLGRLVLGEPGAAAVHAARHRRAAAAATTSSCRAPRSW